MAHTFMQPGMGSWYWAAAIAQSATQQAHLSHRALEPAPRINDPPAQEEDKHDGHCHTGIVEVVLGDCRGGEGAGEHEGQEVSTIGRKGCWSSLMRGRKQPGMPGIPISQRSSGAAVQRCSGAAVQRCSGAALRCKQAGTWVHGGDHEDAGDKQNPQHRQGANGDAEGSQVELAPLKRLAGLQARPGRQSRACFAVVQHAGAACCTAVQSAVQRPGLLSLSSAQGSPC